MALKVFDGLDGYTSSTDWLARKGFLQWQLPNMAVPSTFHFITGLSAYGQCLEFGDSVNIGSTQAVIRAVWEDRNAEAFVGFRMFIPLGWGLSLTLMDAVAATAQLTIVFNPGNYSISAYRGTSGGTLLGLSANNVWFGGTNQFVELHFKIANSGGEIEVRIADDAVLTLTGQDTQNTANAWSDALDFVPFRPSGFGNYSCKIDDLYYCDTTTGPGAFACNTYLGDVGTRALVPTGDGATIQWTPNSGSNHYSRAADAAMDSDSSFNSSATAGQEDQLTHAPIVNVIPIIYGVQVRIAARKDDVGPRIIKTGLNSGGTVDYGANHSVPDTYAYFTDLWILDPHTGANWTRTAVNALLSVYNLVS